MSKKHLVIVESPTKAKTIGRFLGKDYLVTSSFGHVRDLPKTKLGVDVEHDFEPTYTVPVRAKKVVAELKAYAKKADIIYLATDEDREGEAISWHLVELLKPNPKKVKRIAFHEITAEAITEALAHPRDLDQHLVDAQQARRILDRLVGYELSPFLWQKITKGLSAGRVQSVAVRLIVEREREIQKFISQEYWTVAGLFGKGTEEFMAELTKLKGEALTKFSLGDKTTTDKVVADINKLAGWHISSLDQKETKRTPGTPYTTSTLQQDANHQLGFSAKQTMTLAQRLYEGVELAEGQVGLITYMRTDSTNLAEKFLTETQSYIKEELGAKYTTGARRYATKNKNAQEAHEAIRPTSIRLHPDALKSQMESGMWRLYNLIYRRTLASQLPDARFATTALNITDKTEHAIFRANGARLIFDGFWHVLLERPADNLLPALAEKDPLNLNEIKPEQHFTEPPARYSEATLVKALEAHGIGRPSTYAPTISTIVDRGYVEKIEKRLKPTDLAMLVNDVLVEHFPDIVNLEFTAKMENDLDEIANGNAEWIPVIRQFYEPFSKNLKAKYASVDKKALTETATDAKCEKCGSPMVIKFGRFGKFMACTKYPECKNTKQIGSDGQVEAPETTDEKCPLCSSAMMVKHGRFGKFIACSKYPECKGVKKILKLTGVKCPECQTGDIVEKRSKRGKNFYACSRYPDCKFALWSKPTGEQCPKCKSLVVYAKKDTVACSNKECDFSKETPSSWTAVNNL